MSSIADVVERQPARFGGEVRSPHRSAPGGRPALRVTIHDGTGSDVTVFSSRSRISGLEAARAVLFEGVGRRDHGQVAVVNSAYTLLPCTGDLRLWDAAVLSNLADRYGCWLRITTDDVIRAERWFDRYSNGAVLVCRCIPLIQSLISISAGFRPMPLG